jgi:multicomponent Na+:H+ antiporter subunit F
MGKSRKPPPPHPPKSAEIGTIDGTSGGDPAREHAPLRYFAAPATPSPRPSLMPLDPLPAALAFAFVALAAAFVLAVVRLVLGPTLPDRVVALDLIAFISIGFIALVTLSTATAAYLDVAVALALIAFLATLAFARYVERMGADGIITERPDDDRTV